MKTKNYLMGIILCLVATVAWGGMFPVMNPALQIIDPVYFTLIRYSSVGIIFAILLLFTEGFKAFKPEGHFKKLWLLGTFAFAGFNLLVFLGQHIAGKSGSLIASVMMAVQPLIGALLNWLFKKKRPSNVAFISMLIALVGIFLVVTKGNPAALSGGMTIVYATLLIFIADLCWVLFTMGGEDFKDWSILRYSTLTTIYGVLSVAVITVIATLLGWINVPTLMQLDKIKPAFLYMIAFAGVIALFSWNLGNRYLGPINGILFMNVEPITAFLVMTLSGYPTTAAEIIGCILTITALIINNLYLRFQKKAPKSEITE